MRHIEKLKKIFTCCGKECSADTNGKALDQLVTLAENGELGGGGVDIPTVLKSVEISRVKIPSDVDTPFETSIQKDVDLSNYYLVIRSPNNESIVMDDINYTGGGTSNLIPETKVTGSGSYTYKIDYQIASNTQIRFFITTTAYSYNTDYVDLLLIKKEL